MAQALAFVDREPGVVVLAGGPELTNALTAIAQASYACTPLVVISGSNTLQKRDRGFPQDMDQLQVVRPFTKWARSCHAVERIPECIEAAFRNAIRGRPGPTYVEIPYDVMESKLRPGEAVYPEKPALLRRSWAVALASPKEGWGLTNVEAEACGTPVVASDSRGIRESVRNGETGFLVPQGDVAGLAAAMDRLAKQMKSWL